MEGQDGDFLRPTRFQTTFGPLEPGETIFKIQVVDAAGNSSETPPRSVIPGNFDGDGDVDQNDLSILLADRNKSVSTSTCGAPCDFDGDGRITALDARKFRLLCTRSRCALE